MPKFAHVTNSLNIMLTITAREFKANQQHYLDQVDAGEELIVERSQGRSYMVVPVTETDVRSYRVGRCPPGHSEFKFR